ncbi:MAG TPA: hypothetical protein VII75_15075 [Thermoanaerobaculia bacterium]
MANPMDGVSRFDRFILDHRQRILMRDGEIVRLTQSFRPPRAPRLAAGSPLTAAWRTCWGSINRCAAWQIALATPGRQQAYLRAVGLLSHSGRDARI